MLRISPLTGATLVADHPTQAALRKAVPNLDWFIRPWKWIELHRSLPASTKTQVCCCQSASGFHAGCSSLQIQGRGEIDDRGARRIAPWLRPQLILSMRSRRGVEQLVDRVAPRS
jgi:hypothetical protein